MTDREFEALANARRMAPQNVAACRAVLVGGMSQADAARMLGVSRVRMLALLRQIQRVKPSAVRYPATWQTVSVRVPPDVARQIRELAKAAQRAFEEGDDQS